MRVEAFVEDDENGDGDDGDVGLATNRHEPLGPTLDLVATCRPLLLDVVPLPVAPIDPQRTVFFALLGLALPWVRPEYSPGLYAYGALVLPVLVAYSLSLNWDLLALVSAERDVLVGSLANAVHWGALGLAFSDLRALGCAVEWWILQLALLGDADARGLSREEVLAWGSLGTLGGFLAHACSTSIHPPGHPLLTMNGRYLTLLEIVLWTVPTLLVLLSRRLRWPTTGRRRSTATIPSDPKAPTTTTATMMMRRLATGTTPLALLEPEDGDHHGDGPSRQRQRRRVLSTRRRRRRQMLGGACVDLHPIALLWRGETPGPLDTSGLLGVRPTARIHRTRLSRGIATGLHALGVLSLGAVSVGTILAQGESERGVFTRRGLLISGGGLLGALGCGGFTARYYHRGLLGALLRTTDIRLAGVEALVELVLLGDLFQWDPRVLNVVTWDVWFLWVLGLDALTPTARSHLRFTKLAGAPVILFVCYARLGLLLLLYGLKETNLRSRDLGLRGGGGGLRTEGLVVGRALTLVLWHARLFWELGVADESTLTVLRAGLEYHPPSPSRPSAPPPPLTTTTTTTTMTTTDDNRRQS